MNAELLLESFSYIDENLLKKSEKRRPNPRMLASVAACAAVGLLGIGLFFGNRTTIQQKIVSCHPNNQWTITYNQTESTVADSVAASRKYDYYMLYGEPLNAENLNTLAPDLGDLSLSYSGTSTFGPAGLEWITVEIKDPNLSTVTVQLSEKEFPKNHVTKCATTSSVGGEEGVSVIAYEHRYDERLFLDLGFWLNETVYISIAADAEASQEVAVKQRISDLVACYVIDKKDMNLDSVTSETPPVIRYQDLNFADAQKDPDFGKYFLGEIPSGFTTELIKRMEHPDQNYLHGIWTRNYDQLSWEVSDFKEADKARLTAVKDTENYDLSLYPIPRAESVPDALREIVDNPIFRIEELTLETIKMRAYRVDDAGDTTGERMHFSVLYGTVLVEISSKGVSPEWVYEQLIGLK